MIKHLVLIVVALALLVFGPPLAFDLGVATAYYFDL